MTGPIAPNEPSDDVRRASQRQPHRGGPLLAEFIVIRRSLYASIASSSFPAFVQNRLRRGVHIWSILGLTYGTSPELSLTSLFATGIAPEALDTKVIALNPARLSSPITAMTAP